MSKIDDEDYMIEEKIKEILGWFLYQKSVSKMETEDGIIKVYKVGNNLIRIDIKK